MPIVSNINFKTTILYTYYNSHIPTAVIIAVLTIHYIII